MTEEFIAEKIVSSILLLIYILAVLLNRYCHIKSNDNNTKFLYLNLKETDNLFVSSLKTQYRNYVNGISIALIILMMISMIFSLYIAIITMTILVFASFLIICCVNEKYTKDIKKAYLDKGDKSTLIKLGGLYYYNANDKEDFIKGIYLSDIPNLAKPFWRALYIITILIIIVVIFRMFFTNF